MPCPLLHQLSFLKLALPSTFPYVDLLFACVGLLAVDLPLTFLGVRLAGVNLL
jgi:hypothetical protein